MSVQLTADQETELAELARITERSPDAIAQEAVANFLASRADMVAFVREGDESAGKDGWITHDEVFNRVVHRYRHQV